MMLKECILSVLSVLTVMIATIVVIQNKIKESEEGILDIFWHIILLTKKSTRMAR